MRSDIPQEAKSSLETLIEIANNELNEFKNKGDVKVSIGYDISDFKTVNIRLSCHLSNMLDITISYIDTNSYNLDIKYFNEIRLSRYRSPIEEVNEFIKCYLKEVASRLYKDINVFNNLIDDLVDISKKAVKESKVA